MSNGAHGPGHSCQLFLANFAGPSARAPQRWRLNGASLAHVGWTAAENATPQVVHQYIVSSVINVLYDTFSSRVTLVTATMGLTSGSTQFMVTV